MTLSYAAHVITDADISAVTHVLRSNRLTQGPTVERLEARLCEVHGCDYAVAVSNGTMALWVAYRAADVGFMTTSAITFVATVNAAPRPREVDLVDVDPTTGMACKWRISQATCNVPVSIGGDLPKLPRSTGTWILDAAHCVGNTAIPFDRIAAATVSFHPAKQVAAGEGGAILTNDDEVAVACRELRENGRRLGPGKTYHHGLNCRMDEMSAALALSQLGRVIDTIARRVELADMYDDALRYVPGIVPVPHGPHSARHLYQIRTEDRDGLRAHLLDCGVGSQVLYMPLYVHPYYSHLGKPADYPGAEEWAATSLALPLHNGLTDRDIRYITDAIKSFAERRVAA